jgi:ubiquinone/menaquinone biosynthesis C-methylase UbiE
MSQAGPGSISIHDELRDRDRLKAHYADGSFLRAKHQLAGQTFTRWALSLVPLNSWTRILDAGCGWGRFTWSLIDDYSIAADNITCTDLSVGMLAAAREAVAKRRRSPSFYVADVASLPFGPASFDGAMANHMLYHLPDIGAGVRELARVLKPGGWLLATTNSDSVRVLLIELHQRALERLGVPFVPEGRSPFSLENGGAWLSSWFQRVERFDFATDDRFANPEAVVQTYLTLGRYRSVLERDDLDAAAKQALPETVKRLAQEILEREGELRSPGLIGAFVCRGPVKELY